MSVQTELYENMHANNADYQEKNQGLGCWHSWIDILPDAPCTILEVGCGNGKLCTVLAQSGYEVTGIDLVNGDYGRTGYAFEKLDALQILERFGVQSFDFCLCFDVLEHLEMSEAICVLHQITHAAKKVIVSIACYGAPPLHLTVLSPGTWLDILIQRHAHCDWKVLKIIERGTYQPATLFYGESK